jgi:hypothetical protein
MRLMNMKARGKWGEMPENKGEIPQGQRAWHGCPPARRTCTSAHQISLEGNDVLVRRAHDGTSHDSREKLSFKTFVHDKCLVLSRDAE